MWKQTQRPNVTCPLIDSFHVKNILGARERREIIFGTQIYNDSGTTAKAFTLSSLTGGLITSVDHMQILLQQVGTYSAPTVSDLSGAPTIKPYVTAKSATGFNLNSDDAAAVDVVIKATLPTHPRATPKDAAWYCPYCKFYGFNNICGSIVRDIAIFAGSSSDTASGTTTAVTFAAISAPTRDLGGYDGYVSKSIGGGTLKKPLISEMVFVDTTSYQVILMMTDYTRDVPTAYPYPTVKTSAGFTINGETNAEYDILILGQVKN